MICFARYAVIYYSVLSIKKMYTQKSQSTKYCPLNNNNNDDDDDNEFKNKI